jgi:hypothetical protein
MNNILYSEFDVKEIIKALDDAAAKI